MKTLKVVLTSLALATPALAQDPPDAVEEAKIKEQMKASEEAAKKAAEEGKSLDGWKYDLNIGFNGGFNRNASVVGQPDGSTWQIGAVLNGSANLNAGNHEWRNTLAIAHQQTQTPVIDGFIKTTDNFELESMWLYKLKSLPWFGPFARARLQTQLFTGALAFGEDTDVQFRDPDGKAIPTLNPNENADGTAVRSLPAQERLDITKPFEPLFMRQSVGAFARAVEKKDLKVTFTLGLGAQEVFVRDDAGFAVADDDGTPQLELNQLQDSFVLGAEAGVEANGTVGKQVTWSFTANMLYPFPGVGDGSEQFTGADAINYETIGKVGVKLAKWASLDYVLTAKKIPLVLDEWQVQNNLLLSTAFNLL